MAYVTLTDFKSYQGISSTADDAVIQTILDGVSAYIEGVTLRKFDGYSATRVFDVPDGDTIFLDEDLYSVTSITNGDATTVTSTQYVLLPPNEYPKYAVRLKSSASISWESDSANDYEQAISITGLWGFSQSAPADIVQVCKAIAKRAYMRSKNQPNNEGPATITAAGVVIQAEDMGQMERRVLDNYRRLQLR